MEGYPKFVTVHTLRYQQPGNPNRDELGNAKKIDIGMTERGRVSSQCRKYWIRNSEEFRKNLEDENLGIRTKDVGRILYDALYEGSDLDRGGLALPTYNKYSQEKSILMASIGSAFMEDSFPSKGQKGFMGHAKTSSDLVDRLEKFDPENGDNDNPFKELNKIFQTDAVAFYSHGELKQMIEAAHLVLETHIPEDYSYTGTNKDVIRGWYTDIKNTFETAYADTEISPDVALLGRMKASRPKDNVDGAVFISHDITTNRAESAFDMFTATDDYRKSGSKEDNGSDHLGSRSMIQGVFYSHVTVDVHKLYENLGEDQERTLKVMRAFLRTFCEVAPQAMRTSYGYNSKPFHIRVEKSDLQPVTYHLAFLSPVDATAEYSGQDVTDIAQVSSQRLEEYAQMVEKKWVSDGDTYESASFCTLPKYPLGDTYETLWDVI